MGARIWEAGSGARMVTCQRVPRSQYRQRGSHPPSIRNLLVPQPTCNCEGTDLAITGRANELNHGSLREGVWAREASVRIASPAHPQPTGCQNR